MGKPLVQLLQGQLCGNILKDYRGGKFYSFQGIPYGKPPLAQLRFKAPLPADKWCGTLNAFKDGNPCYQYDYNRQKPLVGSEDCLYLNVFTKSLVSKGSEQVPKRPVMVYIHGGGFKIGSSEHYICGPEFLMTADIVLVTLNYRVGLLGFLSFEDPALGITGNAGIKDCLLALKWVQENIDQFNGDPKNVTVFGASAGTAINHFLILSPLSKGLFQKAILQSASTLNPWALGQNLTLKKFKEFGVKIDTIEELVQHLQTVPVETLYEYQLALKDSLDPCQLRYLSPVVENPLVDKAIITKHPIEIIQSGQYNHVPIIWGHTSREGLLGYKYRTDPNVRGTKCVEALIPHFVHIENDDQKRQIIETLEQYYFGTIHPNVEDSDNMFDLIGDSCFTLGVWHAILLHMINNQKPIFVYRMSVESKLNLMKRMIRIKSPGVCHTDELGYLFKTPLTAKYKELSPEEDTYIQRFVQIWTNFATFGNPTPLDKTIEQRRILQDITWTPFRNDIHNVLDIGINLKMHNHYIPEGIQFLSKLFKQVPTKSHL